MRYDPAFERLAEGEEYVEIPEDVLDSMSTDQKVSYELCRAVKAGSLSASMQEMKPGKLLCNYFLHYKRLL